MYDLYMTHGDIKLDLDYGNDEVCRALNEVNSEREATPFRRSVLLSWIRKYKANIRQQRPMTGRSLVECC